MSKTHVCLNIQSIIFLDIFTAGNTGQEPDCMGSNQIPPLRSCVWDILLNCSVSQFSPHLFQILNNVVGPSWHQYNWMSVPSPTSQGLPHFGVPSSTFSKFPSGTWDQLQWQSYLGTNVPGEPGFHFSPSGCSLISIPHPPVGSARCPQELQDLYLWDHSEALGLALIPGGWPVKLLLARIAQSFLVEISWD